MNKRFFAALAATCILLLGGCQLAQPEAQEAQSTDRLVGVFVTTEYLDLFDMEAYINDNLDDILTGKVPRGEQLNYRDRLYATLRESTHDGLTSSRYEFEGVEGFLMASYQIKDSAGEYWASDVTEGICDVAFGHHVRDNGYKASHSGTIYVCSGGPETVFYFNPVYQAEDGQVYLMSGSGMTFDTGLAGSASQKLNEEATFTEDGVTTVFSSEVEVTMEAIYPADSITLVQMDKNNHILRREEYGITQAPQEISVDADTAYILVEETTPQGIRRSLYQPGDSWLTFFRQLDGSVCIKAQIRIQWP